MMSLFQSYFRSFIRLRNNKCKITFHSLSNIILLEKRGVEYFARLQRPCLFCGQDSWTRSYAVDIKSQRARQAAKNRLSREIAARKKESRRKDAPSKDDFSKMRLVEVWENMTVKQLARAAGRDPEDVFDAMLYLDNCDNYFKFSAELPDALIRDILKILRCHFKMLSDNSEARKETKEIKNLDEVRRPPPDPSRLVVRPPVVAIMGHVDHGKTTLLDSLRHTSVVSQEFGGITQHIGAFSVKVNKGKNSVCFLDTPGHAAFSAMRARGANATDIVVLVVAADDGVMEQTIESIKYAKEAKVPIIVAINKMDKSSADPNRVKEELVIHGVQVETMGGDIQVVEISAKKGQNLDALVEAIFALSEILEIRSDPTGLVEGLVIESTTEPGRGKLTTVLVQRGTLKIRDYLVAGLAWAKVRAIFDERGQAVSSVPPGTPAQVIGWRNLLPSAGEIVLQVETEKRALEVVTWRKKQKEEAQAQASLEVIGQREEKHLAVYKKLLAERRNSGNHTYKHVKDHTRVKEEPEDSTPALHIIIKGDVDGSVEAILDLLGTYKNHDKLRLELVHSGVGKVTVSDLDLAETFNGVIYAFNVGICKEAVAAYETKKVTIKQVNVIYKLAADLKDRISKCLPLVDIEEIIGEANVLQEFQVSSANSKVPVAGCFCTMGSLVKTAKFKVLRKENVLYDGDVKSMFHLKTEVKSVKKDTDCGLMFPDKNIGFKTGDKIVCYEMKPEAQVTDWNPGF